MADGIERIDLGDGQWWDIRTIVTRRMRKAFRAAGLRGFAKGLTGNGHSAVDLSNPEEVQKAVLASPDKWDLDAVDDAYLLEGSAAYSFGDKVNMEAIDALPADVIDKVLARMRELYAEMPEAKRKSFFGSVT